MDGNFPGPDTTATFGTLDRGEAGVVVTTDADIADWADRHGYTVRTISHQGGAFYEISPGDTASGPSPRVHATLPITFSIHEAPCFPERE